MGDDRYDPSRVPVTLNPNAKPTLWRLARLGFDSVRQRPVLLYPEGAVLLNDTGAAILELVDGRRTVAEIGAILGERYQTDVTADVAQYLSDLAEKELIRDV
jgi:pyrroloquinoline quinone biosynthesis protein D